MQLTHKPQSTLPARVLCTVPLYLVNSALVILYGTLVFCEPYRILVALGGLAVYRTWTKSWFGTEPEDFRGSVELIRS